MHPGDKRDWGVGRQLIACQGMGVYGWILLWCLSPGGKTGKACNRIWCSFSSSSDPALRCGAVVAILGSHPAKLNGLVSAGLASNARQTPRDLLLLLN